MLSEHAANLLPDLIFLAAGAKTLAAKAGKVAATSKAGQPIFLGYEEANAALQRLLNGLAMAIPK